MLYRKNLLLFLLLFSFGCITPIQLSALKYFEKFIPLPKPKTHPPAVTEEEAEDFKKHIHNFFDRNEGRMNAGDYYELGLLYIHIKEYRKAHHYLKESIKLDPCFVYSQVQIGYLYLWEDKPKKAYDVFSCILKEHCCNKKAYHGLYLISEHYVRENIHLEKAMQTLKELYACNPDDPEVWLYMAILYQRDGNLSEAKRFFQMCLEDNPCNMDAAIALGYLYLREEQWKKAEALFLLYPENCSALIGLARIKSRVHEDSLSIDFYKKALERCGYHSTFKKEIARALGSSWRYSEAAEQYDIHLIQNPLDFDGWRESFDIRSKTHPAFKAEVTYTAAKENDPQLAVPVVDDFYTYASLYAITPVHDRIRLTTKLFFYNQKENNIYNPALNYDASLAGAQETLEYLFGGSFRLNAFARAFGVWPNQNNKLMAFPFQTTGQFEPGVTIAYHSPLQIFSGDAHIESFITKDFGNDTSMLMRLGSQELHWVLRPDYVYQPEFEASYIQREYWDDNFENIITVWFHVDTPKLEDYLTLTYKFQFSHFDELTASYFSYKEQYWQFFIADLHFDLWQNTKFKAVYEFSWQLSKDLVQPIGDFIFVTDKLSLFGSKITGNLTYLWKHHLHAMLEGHYFYNTLVYRSWNIKGSLLYQF